MKHEIPNGYYTTNELNQYHSYDDEPAVVVYAHKETDMTGEEIDVQGYQAWYKDGQIHRENFPAIIHEDGREYYYLEGNIQE